MFRLESGVGLGGIGRKTVDRQARRCEMLVIVAEQAGLLGACKNMSCEDQIATVCVCVCVEAIGRLETYSQGSRL